MASGLYAIVDPSLAGDRGPIRLAEAVLEGGCARLQLRWKDGGDREVLTLAQELVARCAAARVPFVMNDRPDLALLCGASGVHVGQADLNIADVRQLLGPDRQIGRSTHTRAQAEQAENQGADLIAFGPVFDTSTKSDADPVVGLARLAEICEAVSRPVVAIGGITVERAAEVRGAGAAFGAVISALSQAGDLGAVRGRGPRRGGGGGRAGPGATARGRRSQPGSRR